MCESLKAYIMLFLDKHFAWNRNIPQLTMSSYQACLATFGCGFCDPSSQLDKWTS